MWKSDAHLFNGNERFQGFGVDLIQKISEQLKFEYDLYLVPDGNFGSRTESGEWNGMIGQILNGVGLHSQYQ